MEGKQLLITEVTEMSTGNYCVAGWCAQDNKMVRPLPNGGNSTATRLDTVGVTPGTTLLIVPNTAINNGVFPHRTEDTPVDSNNLNATAVNFRQWFGLNAPPAAATLSAAFENNLHSNSQWNGVSQGVHVPLGTATRSLWGVVISRAQLTFIVEFEKLKAIIDDGNARYKLAVSGRTLKETWRNGGLTAIEQSLSGSGRIHVRVGLARAFGSPADKCYAMVNGILR